MMYHFREVLLKNGPVEKKSLVIEFDDPNMRVVGEFLMADAPLLHGKVLQEIDRILAGEKHEAVSNGNRCALTIKPATTIISDLFTGMEDVATYPTYEISTKDLRELIIIWFQKLKEFQHGG